VVYFGMSGWGLPGDLVQAAKFIAITLSPFLLVRVANALQ